VIGSLATNAGVMGSSVVGCDCHSERRQRYSDRRSKQPGGECRRDGQLCSRRGDNTNVFGRRDRQPGGKYIPSAVEAQFTGLITSDSSERSALINSSEEMAQARDTSTCVTFNALNSTSSPRILDSLLYCSMDAREEKQNLQMLGYDLNFETTLSRS